MKDLHTILASTYSLYLKTQVCHWNVSGPHFHSLHKLFQEQYETMQSRIDGIAELIVMRNQSINASFTEFDKNSMIKSSIEISANWQSMLKHLLEDNKILSDLIRTIIADSEKISDFVAADFFTSQLAEHEKNIWMLDAILS